MVEVVDEDVAAILRTKTPSERLEMAFEMWRSARNMMRSILSAQHPDWSEQEVNAEVAHRMSHGAV